MQQHNKVAIHPTGISLTFNPESHTYISAEKELTSITTLIHNYFPEFDAETVAAKKAKREGTCAEELKALWEKTRVDASMLGKAVHLMAEIILTEGNLESANHLPSSSKELAYLECLKVALSKILKNYEVLGVEYIVFSPKYGVAGTIDLLLRNKKTKNLLIVDWKTNKKINFSSFGNEKGFGPCAKLPNCNFMTYSLQLSLYREILMQENYFSGVEITCAIVHFKSELDKVSFAQIDPKDLSHVAKNILSARV